MTIKVNRYIIIVMKITVLTENTTTNEKVIAEHGLSLYIEACGRKILFDMGQTDLFLQNAAVLGIDLTKVDVAVLSHGHYDHGGGLPAFLQINKTASVYISRYAFGDYYNGTEKYIGLDKSIRSFERVILTDGKISLGDGLTLYHANGKGEKFSLGAFGLTERTENGFIDDRFLHEQYLEITENKKRVLISGCSHKGILNIAGWFCPDVLVGGFHFSKLDLDKTLESYAKYLGGFDTDFYTCHCTGCEQFEFMKKYMPRLNYISAGTMIEI